MRNKNFTKDIKNTRKLGRDKFSLKSWMAANFTEFEQKCPDDASVSEAHQWWEKKAHQTLEPGLAEDVCSILAGGAALMQKAGNPQCIQAFTEVCCSLLGIKL